MEFLVMPDGPGALAPKDEDVTCLDSVIRHESGRPHIIGRWLPSEFTSVTVGRRRLTLIGTFARDEKRLEVFLDRATRAEDVHGIHRTIGGSYFVIYTDPIETRIWGSLSSFRRVSFSERPGFLCASNSLQLIRTHVPSELVEASIPLSLVVPRPPWPMSEPSYWSGIRNLLPTDYLSFSALEGAITGERWQLPKTRRSLDDVAPALRSALHAAVEARADSANGHVSSDLSGGMDSTSLAFFLNAHVDSMTTAHLTVDDSLNEDFRWATRAGELLGSAPITLAQSELEPWFSNWNTYSSTYAEEPLSSIRTEGMHRSMAKILTEAGSEMHIAGSGGDELYYPDESILPGLMREEPRSVLSAAQSMASTHRWSQAKTLHEALFPRSNKRWLSRQLRSLGELEPGRPSASWDVSFNVSPWATPEAVDSIVDALREIEPREMISSRAETDAISYAMICRNGQIHRALDTQFRAEGVRYEAPFLDDHVIELSLSVQLSERLNINTFKPVLAAAAKGVVPDELLGRRSKGDYVSLIYRGYNHIRKEMVGGLETSPLVARGLVDAKPLAQFLTRIQPNASRFYPFEFFLATDRWIRSAQVKK